MIVLVEKGKIVASLHFDCSNYISELSLLSQETKTNDDKKTRKCTLYMSNCKRLGDALMLISILIKRVKQTCLYVHVF